MNRPKRQVFLAAGDDLSRIESKKQMDNFITFSILCIVGKSAVVG